MWFKQKEREGLKVIQWEEFWSKSAWRGSFRNTRKSWPRDPGSLSPCFLSPASHDKGRQEDRERDLVQLCSRLCFWTIPYTLCGLHSDERGWEKEDFYYRPDLPLRHRALTEHLLRCSLALSSLGIQKIYTTLRVLAFEAFTVQLARMACLFGIGAQSSAKWVGSLDGWFGKRSIRRVL